MPCPLSPLECASKPVEAPIPAELFGIERLEQHAASLAAAHQFVTFTRNIREFRDAAGND
jgi:hypothetical protein